jgi:DNA-binding MurR/RpiR family transcriptional regulator
MLGSLSPQLRSAAAYIIEHPEQVAVQTIRGLAGNAKVHPNTLARLAKLAGYAGFKDFKSAFIDVVQRDARQFRGRARKLQTAGKGNHLDQLYEGFAQAALNNVETLFSTHQAASLKQAADKIVNAKRAGVFGVGTAHALAHNFWYVANMALDHIEQIPRQGNLPMDDIAGLRRGDVFLLFSFHPYREDVVEALRMAKRQRCFIIVVTDQLASPIAMHADQVFTTPVNTPQFFTSLTAAYALMETLLGFMVADADRKVVKKIEQFHQNRYDNGVYVPDI